MVITAAHGENVLFLNLFKDEESSEILDSNLESDLLSAYNFDEDNESVVFKNNLLNNTEPELTTTLQPKDFEDEQVSSIFKEVTNLQTSQVPGEKTDINSKHTTNENSHFNTYSKDTVEYGSRISNKFNTVLPERSDELDSFMKFCFDIVAYFIHGVMSGITSVGDNLTNSKPTGVTTDLKVSQSPSRKRKRDLQTEIEALSSTEPNKDNSFETNVNQINKVKSAESTFNTDSSTSLAQHKDGDTLQDHMPSNISKQSIESSATLETPKILKDFLTSTIDTGIDSIISDRLSVFKDDNKEHNANSALFNNNSKSDVSELKKNVIGEAISQHDTTSTPNSPLHEKHISTHTGKKDHDLAGTPFSTEEEISNSFLLNDFMNKENDLKLKEIIQKQFATAQLYPQPNEGEYHPNEETSAGTIIMMAVGAVFLVLVLASIGLAAAYKLQLINIGRHRFGNQNPSSQRNTMA